MGLRGLGRLCERVKLGIADAFGGSIERVRKLLESTLLGLGELDRPANPASRLLQLSGDGGQSLLQRVARVLKA